MAAPGPRAAPPPRVRSPPRPKKNPPTPPPPVSAARSLDSFMARGELQYADIIFVRGKHFQQLQNAGVQPEAVVVAVRGLGRPISACTGGVPGLNYAGRFQFIMMISMLCIPNLQGRESLSNTTCRPGWRGSLSPTREWVQLLLAKNTTSFLLVTALFQLYLRANLTSTTMLRRSTRMLFCKASKLSMLLVFMRSLLLLTLALSASLLDLVPKYFMFLATRPSG